MTDITALREAMLRAEQTHKTDDETLLAAGKRINEAILKELKENDGILTSIQALEIVACILGEAIKVNRTGGPVSGLLVAVEIAKIILEIATED